MSGCDFLDIFLGDEPTSSVGILFFRGGIAFGIIHWS